MTSRIERLLIALMFALLAAGITLVIASAQGEVPSTGSTNSENCAVCHTEFEMTWENGAHGKAGSDPLFQKDWITAGFSVRSVFPGHLKFSMSNSTILRGS